MAGIGTHLQRQRPHAKGRHQRAGQRLDCRGYPDDCTPWGGQGWDPIVGSPTPTVPSTGATAGIPGIWTPAGSLRPATQLDLINGIPNPVIASPLTQWSGGQFVQTRQSGAAGRACWSGIGWVGGIAPGLLDGTIDEVKSYVLSLPTDDERASIIQELLDEERANKNRATLVSWLDQQTGVE